MRKIKLRMDEVDNLSQKEGYAHLMVEMTIVVIVWIFVIILGYFSNRHSKETEKRVKDFIEQKDGTDRPSLTIVVPFFC